MKKDIVMKPIELRQNSVTLMISPNSGPTESAKEKENWRFSHDERRATTPVKISEKVNS
jgi:hypothetical protein